MFSLLCLDVAKKSPTGWKLSKNGKMRYLWFPSQALDDGDLARISDWKEHFEQYVLIGLNENISAHFKEELDFCMALDYNRDPQAERRTYYGEAVYQLKYRQSLPHVSALQAALVEAAGYLPLSTEDRKALILTNVPCDPEACNVPRKLATAIAKSLTATYIQADLFCDKNAMKGLTLDQKIPEWQALYGCSGCITLHGDVAGKSVLIIDDLYQSGATMWCCAKYLKERGARHVLGLPCVKTLGDTDNS
jgi:predicted amidophosphoribosyltransferase